MVRAAQGAVPSAPRRVVLASAIDLPELLKEFYLLGFLVIRLKPVKYSKINVTGHSTASPCYAGEQAEPLAAWGRAGHTVDRGRLGGSSQPQGEPGGWWVGGPQSRCPRASLRSSGLRTSSLFPPADGAPAADMAGGLLHAGPPSLLWAPATCPGFGPRVPCPHGEGMTPGLWPRGGGYPWAA